ncbi:endonuclease/exonuclease/phosphatase family protein [Mycolicibacterium diernhoferi]|uniref:endonuclease/exonuclease/phosphatase family protein n=1 Tax=Mycolicibacterium diernhoferi TaxID=1801 RepID=UPI001FD138B4|nr:endonuclease/exonuclease/phosphatase family protein [Mycolicibacterium diernhoferi]
MSAPRWRTAAGLIGGLAWVIATVGVGAHFVGMTSTLVAWIAAFTPVAVLVSAVAVVLLLIGGHRWVAVAATVVLLVGIGTQAPLYRAGAPVESSGPSVRVMQANIRLGGADPVALVDSVDAHGVDLLTVIELTDSAAAKLADAGLEDALPNTCGHPRPGGGGAGIYSRHPLRECARLDGFVLNNLRAVAEIPGAAPTAVYALHPLPPYPEPAWKWVYELKRLRPIFAAEPYPMIVGADFNSTYDHRQYRDLLSNSTPNGGASLIDAAEYLGAGVVPTYPADRMLPPVLAIDRILARGWVPMSFTRFDLPGSDHLGVVGALQLPEMNSN